MMIQIDTEDGSTLASEEIKAAIQFLVAFHCELVRAALDAADEREWTEAVQALPMDLEPGEDIELEPLEDWPLDSLPAPL